MKYEHAKPRDNPGTSGYDNFSIGKEITKTWKSFNDMTWYVTIIVNNFLTMQTWYRRAPNKRRVWNYSTG